MRNMKLIIAIFILSVGYSFGQIQSQDFYSFRMSNMFNVNPAYASYSKGVNIYLGGISQTSGVDFNTRSLTAGVHSQIARKMGIGGTVISDMRGAFQTTKANISYSYTAKVNEMANLTLGLSSGIMNYTLNNSRIAGYEYLDPTDPTLAKDYYNRTQFVAGAGLLFRWKELDVSLSLPHMIETNNILNTYFHSYSEYRFKAGAEFKVAPSFAFQYIPTLGSVYSGYVKGIYKDMFWLKSGYQSNQSIHAMAGVMVENLGIEYGFRFSNSEFKTVASGVHELNLIINIPDKKTKGRYNPTLVEIDHRLTKLLTKKITDKNREAVIAEVKEIKRLMENTEINNSTPDAADEAADYLKKIEQKLIELQNKLNEK